MSVAALEPEVVTEVQAVTYPVTAAAIAHKKFQYELLKPTTPEMYELVRLAIADCRTTRVAIENRRQELKAASLAYGRTVDGQAKALTQLLREIEQPLQAMKDAVDQEKERKRLEAERIERERVEAEIRAKREAEEAEAKRLRDEEEKRLAAEAERLRVEREAFEREKAEREAIEAEARRKDDERRAAEDARLAAERKRIEDARAEEDKRQNEQRALIEAERRKVEEQRLATERDEAERQARIRAEEEARAKVERDRIAAEEAKRAEEKRAAEHAAELEAMKGDSTRILELADAIGGLAIPKVKAARAKRLIEEARESLNAVATGLREAVSK